MHDDRRRRLLRQQRLVGEILYQDDGELLYHLGRLLRHSAPFRARCYLALAHHKLDGENERLRALHDFYSVGPLLFDTWRMRKINDKKRNLMLSIALESSIKGGHKFVLDVGAGAGLLSITAARHAEYMACLEDSLDIYYILRDNLLMIQSFPLCPMTRTYATSAIYKPVKEREPLSFDLIVSETLDSSALGDNIIASMRDAHRLASSSAKFCPSEVTIYVQLLQSESFFASERFVDPSDLTRCYANGREETEEEKEKRKERERKREEMEKRKKKRTKKKQKKGEEKAMEEEEMRVEREENAARKKRMRPPGGCFSTIRLPDFPDHKILSAPEKILTVKFNDPEKLKEYLGDAFEVPVSVKAIENGTVHAYLVSFKTSLAPISNCKLDSISEADGAWVYAAFPRLTPRRVDKDEIFSFRAQVHNGQLAFQDPKPESSTLVQSVVQGGFPDGLMTWANNVKAQGFIGLERIMKWITAIPQCKSRFMNDFAWPLSPDGCLFHKGYLNMILHRQKYETRHDLDDEGKKKLEEYPPLLAGLKSIGVLFRNDRLDRHCRYKSENHCGVNISSASLPLVEYRGIRAPFHEKNDFIQLSKEFDIFEYPGIRSEDFDVKEEAPPRKQHKVLPVKDEGPVDGILYWWVVKHVDGHSILDTRKAGLPVAAALFPERAPPNEEKELSFILLDYLSSYLALAGSESEILTQSKTLTEPFMKIPKLDVYETHPN